MKPFIPDALPIKTLDYSWLIGVVWQAHAVLDFIINYDIKYRMGKELDGGEEDGVAA